MAELPDPAELLDLPAHDSKLARMDKAPEEIREYVRTYCRLWAEKLEAGGDTAASWTRLCDVLKGHYSISRSSLARWCKKDQPELYEIIEKGRYG